PDGRVDPGGPACGPHSAVVESEVAAWAGGLSGSVDPDDDLPRGAAFEVVECGGEVSQRVLGGDHRAEGNVVGRADQVLQRCPVTDLDAVDPELLPCELGDVAGDLVAVEDA